MAEFSPRRGYADSDFAQIQYREWGAGDALVMLHSLAQSSRQFLEAGPVLGRRFRVIAPDMPGFGDSDQPSTPLLVEDHARAVLQLMDALGVAHARFFGHGFGALVAVEIAASTPRRVTALAVSDFPPHVDANVRSNPVDDSGIHFDRGWARATAPLQGWASIEQMHRATIDTMKASEGDFQAERAAAVYGVWTAFARVDAPVTHLVGAEEAEAAASVAHHKSAGRYEVAVVKAPTALQAMMSDPENFAARIGQGEAVSA